MSQKILKNYISPIDELMKKFDKEHPKLSATQQNEYEKAQRVAYLRDTVNRSDEKPLPEGF